MSKEIKNSLWMATGKLSSILGGLVFYSILSKSVSQDIYGKYNLTILLMSSCLIFCQFGINQCLAKFYNDQSVNNFDLLKTTIRFQLLTTFFAVAALSFFLDSIYLILILASIVFKPLDLYRAAFDSELRSIKYQKYDIGTVFIFSLLKISSAFYGNINLVCVVILIEAISLAMIAKLAAKKINWRRSGKNLPIKIILRESIPVLIPSLLYIVYSRTDQAIIYAFLPISEQAKYFAAMQLSEGFGFITASIAVSYFATMTKIGGSDSSEYKQCLIFASYTISRVTVPIALFMSIFGEYIIQLVFTDEYSDAWKALAALSWCFVVLGHSSITVRHLITIGMQKISLRRTIIGILVNVPLTVLLIPKYGIFGAAIATLMAQFTALFLSNLLFKDTKFLFKIQVKSLLMVKF